MVFTNGNLDGWAGGSLGIEPAPDNRGGGNNASQPNKPPVSPPGGGDDGSDSSKESVPGGRNGSNGRVGGGGSSVHHGSDGRGREAPAGTVGAAVAAGSIDANVGSSVRDNAGPHGYLNLSSLLLPPPDISTSSIGDSWSGAGRTDGSSSSSIGRPGGDNKHHHGDHHHHHRRAKLAYVIYQGASHCTDTHSFAWKTPGEPPEWKVQRARAMDYAVEFMEQHRQAAMDPADRGPFDQQPNRPKPRPDALQQ